MHSGRPKLIFHIGGHDFHPVYEQVPALVAMLGPDYVCHTAESLAAFEHLGECDLLVFVGMYATAWEGRYRPPGEVHKRALERYVESGRPMLLLHGAVASYDDWPRFSELVGIGFRHRAPCFLPAGLFPMRVSAQIHPATTGMNDYTVFDAPPCDLQIASDMRSNVLVRTVYGDAELPMVVAAEGGRTTGAGRVAYLGHGHDLRSLDSPAVRRLWVNTVQWCLSAG